MKNYYELLEVDKNASSEIIDKAYKTLAKRYHPDVNKDDKKDWAEENFKKISEAYEILSDKDKRATYDKELSDSTIDYSEKYQELLKQQQLLKQELEILRKKYASYNSTFEQPSYSKPNNNYYDDSEQIFYKKNYNDYSSESNKNSDNFDHNYNINIKNNIFEHLVNTIKYRFKNFLALIITIIILLLIILLLWKIPFTQKYLVTFYEENPIIKWIVNIFI